MENNEDIISTNAKILYYILKVSTNLSKKKIKEIMLRYNVSTCTYKYTFSHSINIHLIVKKKKSTV